MRAYANSKNPEERFLSNVEMQFNNITLNAEEKNSVKIKLDHLLEKAPLNSNIILEVSSSASEMIVNIVLNCGTNFFTAKENESTWQLALEAASKKIESQLLIWKKERDLSFIRVPNKTLYDT